MIQYAGQPHGISGHWNNVPRMLNELRWWETYLKPTPATTTFIELVEDAMRACRLTRDDVALIVPHQVNERIIEAAMKKLELPPEKFFINIQKYGNTSAASVPIALDEARREGRLKRGDVAILLAFGAGLTWGSAVVRL